MIIDLTPLDERGLDFSRPPHERKWSALTNVVFKDGSLVNRPGFRPVYDYVTLPFALNVEPAPTGALVELINPDSSAQRAGFFWDTEILRPDGSASIVAGWSASNTSLHEDVDESGGQDGNYASSSTQGAQFYLTFGNPGTTYDEIYGVGIMVVAESPFTSGNSDATFKIYQRSLGGTLTAVDSATVRTYDIDESSFRTVFYFLLEKDYVNDDEWSSTDLNNLQIAIEHESSTTESTYSPSVSSIVASGFTDASDGGAASADDITLQEVTNSSDNIVASKGNGLKATAADSTVEVTFSNIDNTWDSIAQVSLNFGVTVPANEPFEYEIYYDNGSTETLIDSGQSLADCEDYSFPIVVNMTTDPEDSNAWTKTKVNAASWKFQLKTNSSQDVVIRFAELQVSGIVNSGSIRIHQVYAEVLGTGSGSAPARLNLSNKSFLRYDPSQSDFDNVTNSVASTSVPSFVPFDWAILYGQVYVVNGTDPTKRYPNSSSVFESLTTNDAAGTGAITGKTVASFAGRILYGWVNDAGTITPERIAYSKLNDGGTHDDDSAGDLDIIDTMGGIVALKALNEDLCFCGKETGIYALRRTGNDIAPIIVDPIDYDTRCISQHSVQRVVLDGRPVILFLGWNATLGMSIFAFDGTRVESVGGPISRFLNEDAHAKYLRLAIGGIDPITSSYVLFFGEGTSLDRTSAFAMNLQSKSWTKWELIQSVTSAGIFSVPRLEEFRNNDEHGGLPQMVLGMEDNLGHEAHPFPYDVVTLGADQITGSTNSDQAGDLRTLFTSTIETGDFQFVTEEGEFQITSARLHLTYTNYGPVRLLLSTSTDGGTTWSSETEKFIGEFAASYGDRRHSLLDLGNLVNDRVVRFRIRVKPVDAQQTTPFRWQFDRLFIDYNLGGVDGP